LMKRVRESLTKPLPESPAQRSDWQFISKFGMGGAYR